MSRLSFDWPVLTSAGKPGPGTTWRVDCTATVFSKLYGRRRRRGVRLVFDGDGGIGLGHRGLEPHPYTTEKEAEILTTSATPEKRSREVRSMPRRSPWREKYQETTVSNGARVRFAPQVFRGQGRRPMRIQTHRRRRSLVDD